MKARLTLSLALAGTLALGFVGPIDVAHAATITVNSTGDDNPADPDDGDCTLREAVDAANSDTAEDGCPAGDAAGADVINLPAGTYTFAIPGNSEDAGETGDIDVLTPINVQGAGPNMTIIDAAGLDRAFHIPMAIPDPGVSFTGVTIRGGDIEALDGGGAIFNEGAALTLQTVALVQNKAEYGGGVANDDPGSITVIDSLIAGNTALPDVGGGLDLDEVVSSLTNVTVSGNTAKEGAGLWMSDGSSTLNNVTVTDNTSTHTADGGAVANNSDSSTVTVRNSILAGNRNTSAVPAGDCSETIVSQGHNVIGDNTGCTITPTTGDQIGTGAAPIDPKVGPLADNGGPTSTHALLPGSPAVDGGDPAAPGSTGTSCAATDQRGVPRNCDIGAYELVVCKGVAINRIGTPGNDVLTGTSEADGFLGGAGNDTAKGLRGSDAACMGGGKDTASGGGGRDTLLGEAGKDTLKGQGGKDRLKGGPGKDTCTGGGGRDKGTCEKEKKIP